MLTELFKKLVVALLLSAPTAGMAFNVTVDDFGGAGNSTNGSFVAGVWTPTADSNLDAADLQVALDAGNAGITTNGAGDIVFDSGTPVFPTTATRNLSLQAEGSVTLGAIEAAGPSPLNISVTASGDVAVGLAGIETFGGDFSSSGTDFSCSASCIGTDGGKISLNHTGSVTILDGGVSTQGGNYSSSGTDFSCEAGCISTNEGNISLNHTGSVTISDGGASTQGGNYSSSGTDFFCKGGCIRTNAGNISLNHTGSVTILEGGASTQGGNYSSSGTDFFCDSSCIETNGGNISLNHTGNLTVTDGGITSGSGKIVAKAAGDIAISDNGVRSGGGDITLYYGNNLSLAAASYIVSGPGSLVSGVWTPTAPGGNIILHAVNSMTIDGEVSSASGSGGTLSADDGVTVSGTGATTAGAGDVRLYLRSQLQILDILNPAVTPVPTLGALGAGLLASLMMMLGWHRRRAVG